MSRINYGFYILVLFALVTGSVIIALLTKVPLLFAAKALFICQKLFSNTRLEIPSAVSEAFILIIGLVLGTGLLSFSLQLWKTQMLVKKLLKRKTRSSKNLRETIKFLGLKNKVILIKNSNLFSFCCGIFSPWIVITTSLVESLTDKELEAVLLHEQSHLLSRDPIKLLIGKTFSSMFFFLPIFAELHKNIEAVNELLADQWAISHQQKSTFLRGALKKILAVPQLNLNFVSNLAKPDYFEIRIHRLVNPEIKHKLGLSLTSLVSTFLFVFVSWFLLQTPASAFQTDSQLAPVHCYTPYKFPIDKIITGLLH